MRLIFHLGQPKAASSYLQQSFFPCVDERLVYNPSEVLDLLVEMERIIYIHDGLDLAELDRYKEKFIALLSAYTNETVLLSRECQGLHFGDMNRPRYMAEAIGHIFPDAELLFILREQSAWIKSLYGLNIRYGYLESFKKYIVWRGGDFGDKRAGSDRWNIDKRALDFESQVELYHNPVIHIMRYEWLVEDAAAFENHLLDILGYQLVREVDHKRVNVNLSPNELKGIDFLCRKFNLGALWNESYYYLPYQRREGLWNKIRYRMYKAFTKGVIFISPLFGRYINTAYYTEDMREIVRSYYAENNIKFWNGNNYILRD